MAATHRLRVRSASYAPCPSCNEGSLSWDERLAATRCVACKEVI